MIESQPKKSLGQHWLTDKGILQSIVEAGDVNHDDVVIEIGPGTGTLTEKLLHTGAEVWAVEFDETLISPLQQKFLQYDQTKFRVEHADIRTYDFRKPKSGYKIIANIPYYLTSHLIRNISERENPPERAVLLIQKEVAQRVAAEPGDMSLLSVSSQYYWQVSLGQEVPAKFFTPPPKVDSRIVILQRRRMPLFGSIDEKKYFRIVKAGFSNRRKTLLNSLSGGLHLSKDETRALLNKAAIKESARPQELSLDQWYQLYKNLD